MHCNPGRFCARFGAARTVSTVLGLFALSSLPMASGCGALGLTYSLTGLTVEPASGLTCIFPGATAQYHAYGTYTEGGHTARTEDITDQVQWSVQFAQLATISSSGLLTSTGDATGTGGILATTQGEFGTLTSTSNIQVASPCGSTSSPAAVTSPSPLNVIPATATLNSIGDTEEPLAIETLSLKTAPTDVTSKVTWTSSDPSVAAVDAAGRIRAVGPGKAIITVGKTNPDGTVLSATQSVSVPRQSQDQ